MKLMICVVQSRYRDALEEGLKEKSYRMTELASRGSFLKRGSTTFLIGISEEHIEEIKKSMKEICLSVEDKKGKCKDNSSRYTSFLVDVNDSLPFLQQVEK